MARKAQKSKRLTIAEVRKLTLKDIKRSGLQTQHSKLMMLKPHSESETETLISAKKPSYEIPYFDTSNTQIEYSRFKILDDSSAGYKYLQAVGTRPRPYFVPGAPHDRILKDPSIDIYITEGEKKAAAAYYLYNLYCIGLGGISSYQSKSNLVELLDDFESINFDGRNVILVPDSDIKTNSNVAREVFQLARQLYKQKANTFIKILPSSNDTKTGLDDYFLTHSLLEFLKLKNQKFVAASFIEHCKLPATEAGNAELFSLLSDNNLRYDSNLQAWFQFSKNNWSIISELELKQLAKQTIRLRQRAAENDTDLKKILTRYENNRSFNNIIDISKSETPIFFKGSWNLNNFLLGCSNGTVDLRTGKLMNPCRTDYICFNTNTAFNKKATCPRFLEFLEEIFSSNRQTIKFVQRIFGYCLTGDISEQVMFIFIGSGSNGKSLLISSVANALGQYTYCAPSTLIDKFRSSSVPNDLASIAGRRLVTVSECDSSTRLDESRIKALVGGDNVSARFLHKEYFEFTPKAKFILSSNHKPRIEDDSNGMWRRIILVPFGVTFSGKKVDKYLHEKLISEKEGILNWCIKGCMDWQSNGLIMPVGLKQLIEDYKNQEDPLSEFLQEACIQSDESRCKPSELYSAYMEWVFAKSIKYPLGQRTFYEKANLRFQKKTLKGNATYRGITPKKSKF